jgi:hypothetical protein
MDASRWPPVELVEGETDEFGHAEPASESQMQHGPIANA